MKLLAWLLDLLYPPKCVICGKLLEKQGPVCPRCLDSLPEYDGAAPQVRFTEAGAVSFYYEGALRESFLRFKFGGAAHYAAVYGAWMAHTIEDKLAGRFDTLTWAPSAAGGGARAGMTSQSFCAARSQSGSAWSRSACCARRAIRPPSRPWLIRPGGGQTSPAPTSRNGPPDLTAGASC